MRAFVKNNIFYCFFDLSLKYVMFFFLQYNRNLKKCFEVNKRYGYSRDTNNIGHMSQNNN